MINADHAAMVDGDILLFNLPQSAYIYRKSRTAHAPSNFLEVGVRLLETGEDAAIGDRNFRSRLYGVHLATLSVPWYKTQPLQFKKNVFFMYDGAPAHSAKKTVTFLDKMGLKGARLIK